MMFWSVGVFYYMVYGIWYVVYGMKMAFTVYLHMIRVRRALAGYNVVPLFLVLYCSTYRPVTLTKICNKQTLLRYIWYMRCLYHIILIGLSY